MIYNWELYQGNVAHPHAPPHSWVRVALDWGGWSSTRRRRVGRPPFRAPADDCPTLHIALRPRADAAPGTTASSCAAAPGTSYGFAVDVARIGRVNAPLVATDPAGGLPHTPTQERGRGGTPLGYCFEGAERGSATATAAIGHMRWCLCLLLFTKPIEFSLPRPARGALGDRERGDFSGRPPC